MPIRMRLIGALAGYLPLVVFGLAALATEVRGFVVNRAADIDYPIWAPRKS
jgi:hypothetical protein